MRTVFAGAIDASDVVRRGRDEFPQGESARRPVADLRCGDSGLGAAGGMAAPVLSARGMEALLLCLLGALAGEPAWGQERTWAFGPFENPAPRTRSSRRVERPAS